MENNLGNKKVLAKNLQYYMDIRNVSRNELCHTLGIKYTTLADWINARTYPRIDKLELMARYFGINKADLVEEKSEKEQAITSLLSSIAQLTPENREKLADYLALLLQTQK